VAHEVSSSVAKSNRLIASPTGRRGASPSSSTAAPARARW
jgi:hypothetical protein